MSDARLRWSLNRLNLLQYNFTLNWPHQSRQVRCEWVWRMVKCVCVCVWGWWWRWCSCGQEPRIDQEWGHGQAVKQPNPRQIGLVALVCKLNFITEGFYSAPWWYGVIHDLSRTCVRVGFLIYFLVALLGGLAFGLVYKVNLKDKACSILCYILGLSFAPF